MVPSAAMGRDIPVAFQGGGPHAVVLLDAFNAAPDVSNWVTAGNAMNTLAGKGISVAAPAGGAWSMYTNWEQDGSKQWETFLADELPNWLAANKGLAPGGHGIVGAAQGGTGALTHGDLPPRPLPLRRLAVGLPDPVEHRAERRDHRRARTLRRRRHPQHVGSATAGPLEVARPGRARAAAGRQQHPAVGVQPGHHHVHRPGRDDRLLRPGPGQQPDLLSALPRRRRQQRALRLPDQRQPRLGRRGARSWPRCRANWSPPSGDPPAGKSRPGSPAGSRYLGGRAARVQDGDRQGWQGCRCWWPRRRPG